MIRSVLSARREGLSPPGRLRADFIVTERIAQGSFSVRLSFLRMESGPADSTGGDTHPSGTWPAPILLRRFVGGLKGTLAAPEAAERRPGEKAETWRQSPQRPGRPARDLEGPRETWKARKRPGRPAEDLKRPSTCRAGTASLLTVWIRQSGFDSLDSRVGSQVRRRPRAEWPRSRVEREGGKTVQRPAEGRRSIG